MNLPRPFIDESWAGDDGQNYLITLAPKLSDYHARLDYDQAGNANVTIVRNSDNMTVLDMSLDNGEINQIEAPLFTN